MEGLTLNPARTSMIRKHSLSAASAVMFAKLTNSQSRLQIRARDDNVRAALKALPIANEHLNPN
jgi:hypothetical protein